MMYFKSFDYKLKVLIGRNDKMVCDNMVFKRVSSTTMEWVQIYNLEIDHYTTATFVCEENIVYGLIASGKVVSFRYDPDDLHTPYKKMQRFSTGIKMSYRNNMVDNMKYCRFKPNFFFAVIRRDLLRINFNDLLPSNDSNSEILFRSDRVSKTILDYKQPDEIKILILTEFQVAMIDQFTL
jgi:hypothetical protein